MVIAADLRDRFDEAIKAGGDRLDVGGVDAVGPPEHHDVPQGR